MADLGCSPNAAVAFDYLVGKGLRDYQAAAIIGNLQQESRLNPRAMSPPDPVQPSRGIAQWQPPGWQALEVYANGRDVWSFQTQLKFLWYQLETTPYLGLEQLRAATTLEDAVVAFQDRFERPNAAKAATQNRIAYAQSALYACPGVKPPIKSRSGLVVAAAAGVIALVGAAGYGVYKALSGRQREPEPEPMPERFFPPPYHPPTIYRRREF